MSFQAVSDDAIHATNLTSSPHAPFSPKRHRRSRAPGLLRTRNRSGRPLLLRAAYKGAVVCWTGARGCSEYTSVSEVLGHLDPVQLPSLTMTCGPQAIFGRG